MRVLCILKIFHWMCLYIYSNLRIHMYLSTLADKHRKIEHCSLIYIVRFCQILQNVVLEKHRFFKKICPINGMILLDKIISHTAWSISCDVHI